MQLTISSPYTYIEQWYSNDLKKYILYIQIMNKIHDVSKK